MDLEEPKFRTDNLNPLTELSEVRFELEADGDRFELRCRLLFGKMQYEHRDQEYEVGVSRAHLRLSLEGCETTLDARFGESLLEAVVEEDSFETQSSFGVDASCSANLTAGAKAELRGIGGASAARKRVRTQSTHYLPVVARPNDSWEVKPKNVTGAAIPIVEGTAIPGAKLCVVRRKQGGNRMAIIGEVQVAKSAIKVVSKRGNRLGKSMSEWTNKDAIVSQVLKRAIQREASVSLNLVSSSAVAISRCEISEE